MLSIRVIFRTRRLEAAWAGRGLDPRPMEPPTSAPATDWTSPAWSETGATQRLKATYLQAPLLAPFLILLSLLSPMTVPCVYTPLLFRHGPLVTAIVTSYP